MSWVDLSVMTTPAVEVLSFKVPPKTIRLTAAAPEFWINMDLVDSKRSFQSFGGIGDVNGTSSMAAVCFFLYH
mgnify:CR=1 FL=1